MANLGVSPLTTVYPAYYYIKAWMESHSDYENVIVQSPGHQGIPGALHTFDLYLEKEYGQPVQHDRDYFVEEVTLLDLPIVTRADVDKDNLNNDPFTFTDSSTSKGQP